MRPCVPSIISAAAPGVACSPERRRAARYTRRRDVDATAGGSEGGPGASTQGAGYAHPRARTPGLRVTCPGAGRRVVIVVPALLLFACAAASPRTVHLGDLPRRPVYDAEWIRSERAAAAVAMAVMEEELGLPRLEVALHILPDREAFRLALLDNGYDQAFAEQTASAVDAVAGHRRVFFNGNALARLPYPVQAGFFAHELTHTLQYEVGGGVRGLSDQWLREGFADWVAARVLAATGVLSIEDFREQRLRALRQHRDLPPLARLATFPDWIGEMRTTPSATMAAMAYLAAEFLVDRHGVPAVLDYFGRFAASQDRLGHFESAFGEPLDAFDAAAIAHLRDLR
jgi:hypothetical protein